MQRQGCIMEMKSISKVCSVLWQTRGAAHPVQGESECLEQESISVFNRKIHKKRCGPHLNNMGAVLLGHALIFHTKKPVRVPNIITSPGPGMPAGML